MYHAHATSKHLEQLRGFREPVTHTSLGNPAQRRLECRPDARGDCVCNFLPRRQEIARQALRCPCLQPRAVRCGRWWQNGELSKCGACKITLYCCKEHQVAHWPEHKAECKAFRKRAAQNSEDNAAFMASEARKLMQLLSEEREQLPKLYKTMAVFQKDKSRPGTLVGPGLPLEIFASDKGHKQRQTRKKEDDKKVETILSALRVMPLRVCSQALMMLRMSTDHQKLDETFLHLDLDEIKASVIDDTASFCANFLAWREGELALVLSTGPEPEAEGKEDAWPDVIEWKPGYGAANLPPPRSRPDSTFPLTQRVSTRHCIHVLGCPVMTPKESTLIRCEGVEDDKADASDHGCEVYYYHRTCWKEVSSIMCPGDVLLLYPGVYPREMWSDLTCPVEVIGVNGRRDKIVLEMKEHEADWFLRITPRREYPGLYYRFANLTMRGTTWEAVLDVRAGYIGGMTPIDRDAPPAHVELANCLIISGKNGVDLYHGGRLHMLGCKLDGGKGYGVNLADGAEARLIDTTITNTGSGDMSIQVYRGRDAAIQISRGSKVKLVRCRVVGNHGHAVQDGQPLDLEEDQRALLAATFSELGIGGGPIDRAMHGDAPPAECVFEDCEVSGNGQCTADCPSSLQTGPCPWHLETTKLGRRLREDEMREEKNRMLHGNIYGEAGRNMKF